MTGAGPARPWWRRRRVAMAAIAVGAQVAFFWMLSLPGEPTEVRVEGPRTQWTMAGDSEGAFEDWLWLMNPGLFLLPSTHDFSAAAWMEMRRSEVGFEPLTMKSQPLPFAPMAAGMSLRGPLLARMDAGPGHRWEVPSGGLTLPASTPPPVPRRTTLRRVSGLEGWQGPEGGEGPAGPEGAIPGPTILRVTINERGDVAVPPVVWEGSGVPAADGLALRWVEGLRWERADGGSGGSSGSGAGWTWGLVAVDWAPAGLDR
ncbi:MAG: hypothetical protein KF833_13210 [Verrucomicrobiae bacterium]|nr:hypothetical protein [Verrucomicrobiae bacterium]